MSVSTSKPFSIKSRIEGNATFVEVSGAIGEGARFGDIQLTAKVTMNLEGVSYINSIGTRSWCLWLARFRAPAEITLVRCPVIMVKSFSSVKGFLTERCQVQSFYVPFYSEKTGERKDVLAIRGTHFEGTDLNLPGIKDSAGNEMELDAVLESYLRFLKPS